jgi:exodeoxyribonuclease-3
VSPIQTFKVATWNINSVRLRIDQVRRFLKDHQPDLLCLQETKCPDDKFPTKAFKEIGYGNIALHGQRGYHGVATVSRVPFLDTQKYDFCKKGDARHVAVTLCPSGRQDITIHNFYVPAGGDEPNPNINEKFSHKIEFLEELAGWFACGPAANGERQILVGDLNVAPLENDVWSHRQLLKVVSHTPLEVEKLQAALDAGNWTDVVRAHVPPEEKLFTWWSYRSRDWRQSNRGRRLDHIWATQPLAQNSVGIDVIFDARDWIKPSDHVPVLAEFEIN